MEALDVPPAIARGLAAWLALALLPALAGASHRTTNFVVEAADGRGRPAGGRARRGLPGLDRQGLARPASCPPGRPPARSRSSSPGARPAA